MFIALQVKNRIRCRWGRYGSKPLQVRFADRIGRHWHTAALQCDRQLHFHRRPFGRSVFASAYLCSDVSHRGLVLSHHRFLFRHHSPRNMYNVGTRIGRHCSKKVQASEVPYLAQGLHHRKCCLHGLSYHRELLPPFVLKYVILFVSQVA